MNRVQRRAAIRQAHGSIAQADADLEAFVKQDRWMAEKILDEVVGKPCEPAVMAEVVKSFQTRLRDAEEALAKFPLVIPSRWARRHELLIDFKAVQVKGLRALGVLVTLQ